MAYVPGTPGGGRIEDPKVKELSNYVQRELLEVARSFEEVTEFRLVKRHVPPKKLKEGLIALADGTNWDPGSGAGLYIYWAGDWEQIWAA